jgi:hypothetical protein
VGSTAAPATGTDTNIPLGIRGSECRPTVNRANPPVDFDRILPGLGEIVPADGMRAFSEGFAWLLG